MELDIIPYPLPGIRHQIDAASWRLAVEGWVKLLGAFAARQLEITSDLAGFLASYIRGSATETQTQAQTAEEGELRRLVFYLVTKIPETLPQPSAELVWDFVSIYGPKNKRAVTKYILGVQSQGAPMVVQRLSKLLLHHTRSEDESAIGNVAVLFSDAELARELLNNDRLYGALDKIGGEFAIRVASRIRATMENAPDPVMVETLLELFPQLSFDTASSVLNQFGGNVESASAYLLENPDALNTSPAATNPAKPSASTNAIDSPSASSSEFDIANAPKEKFIFGKKNPIELTKQPKSVLETTLRLLYEADEDERDDTYAEAEAMDEPYSEATMSIQQIEKYLWEQYEASPQIFAKASRKTSQRGLIRKITDWSDEQIEGWASMLERQPRRMQILRDRYMFRGNNPGRGTSFLDRPQDNRHLQSDISNEPKGEDSGVASKGTPEGSKTDRRSQKRKEQNKARHGNHNRKAGHAKKMAKGMA